MELPHPLNKFLQKERDFVKWDTPLSYRLVGYDYIKLRNFDGSDPNNNLDSSWWRIWIPKSGNINLYLAKDGILYRKYSINNFKYNTEFWKFVSHPSLEEAFDHIYYWLLINDPNKSISYSYREYPPKPKISF